MDKYDVYGIGNALVDTEYEVTDEFLDLAKLPKGVMTLIGEQEQRRLIRLLQQEHHKSILVPAVVASRTSPSNLPRMPAWPACVNYAAKTPSVVTSPSSR